MATAPTIENIAPDDPLLTCAREIIEHYFREMMSYKDGVRYSTDIKFVHNMRVTSRRLRTAMDNFADCFPKPPFKKHYKQIRTITRTLGAIRDLDVLIEHFQRHLSTLSEIEQMDIRGLIEHLQKRRTAAREPMMILFAKLEERNFETEFLKFLSE